MAYVSNVPISQPVSLPKIKVDSEMNGVCWSNKIGFFFNAPQSYFAQIKPPPLSREM
jgi:hypothetical protein